MADRQCPKCGKTFTKPFYLKRHQERKTPCDPILEAAPSGPLSCRYCGRAFTTKQSLSRHTLHYCKIANSEEGMEKLMEHTLQRQLAAQNAKIDAQSKQIERLTELLEKQLALAPQGAAPLTAKAATHVEQANQVNTGPVTNNVTNVTQINIRSWTGEDRILLPTSLLRAAFTENPRLIEYCRLGDDEKVDAERAAPYVVEALVDLVKRAHTADPASRNVYLNPRRADQVMVYDESWKVLPLVEAISALFDSVAGRIHEIIVTDTERKQLPLEVQAAAAWVPNLYEDDRDGYVKRAKGPMSAHLTNLRDPAAQ